MVSLLGIDLNISGKFWKVFIDVVTVYFLIWIIILPFALLFMGLMVIGGKLPNPMEGFSLFQYFPYWLRFLLFAYIVAGIFAFPFTIMAGVAVSRP
ncbi:MAG: hypothetical protein M1151_05350 [Candidatus Thermoplasmatota archaeon]|jgi:hypothetical protein|nr:hypothetical protein [Candidatus Thermoplasmatota archaeon]